MRWYLRLDRRLHAWAARVQLRPVVLLMQGASEAGGSAAYTVAGVALFFGGVPQARALGWRAGMATIVAGLVVAALKRSVRRERPAAHLHRIIPPDRYAFPSGHAAGSWCFVTAALGSWPAAAPWLAPFAALVSASRVFLGVHYPLDAVVGALLGAAIGLLSNLLPVP